MDGIDQASPGYAIKKSAPRTSSEMQSLIEARFGWHLNAESLVFFETLRANNAPAFLQLLDQLTAECASGLMINATHIDMILEKLRGQQNLPSNLDVLLLDYLKQQDPNLDNFKTVIAGLREEQLPWLVEQSKKNQLGHHTLYHAFEVKVRTACAADALGLLPMDDVTDPLFLRNQFLQILFRFAIECHDYIQGKPKSAALGEHPTAEAASAAAVKAWLREAMEVPPEISQLMAYVVDQAIVSATTLIFSKQSPLHLSQLFFLFETHAKSARDPVDPSNQSLIREIHAMVVLIGLCDVFPICIRAVVERPWDQSITRKRSLLDEFTVSSLFTPYFPACSVEVNAQTLRMALVPHFLMMAELQIAPSSDRVKSLPQYPTSEQAERIIRFIRNCQKIHRESPMEFDAYFERMFTSHALSEAVTVVFFSKIASEIAFIKSLAPLVERGEAKLQELGYLDAQGEAVYWHGQGMEKGAQADETSAPVHLELMPPRMNKNDRLINPSIPSVDAINLAALCAFKESVNAEQLSKELLLNATLQAGAMYHEHPELGPTTPMDSQGLRDQLSEVSSGLGGSSFAQSRYSSFHQQSSMRLRPIARPNAQVLTMASTEDPFSDIPFIVSDYADSDSENVNSPRG
jgi:hypothetical protein